MVLGCMCGGIFEMTIIVALCSIVSWFRQCDCHVSNSKRHRSRINFQVWFVLFFNLMTALIGRYISPARRLEDGFT
jgi:hypothetical protein